MAKCEKGYLCEVCGEEVEGILYSDLYLRFVLGEVELEQLPHSPERHIRCNPAQAQYIVDADFEPVICDSMFSKENMDSEFVQSEEERITRGWRQLCRIVNEGLPIEKYRLPKQGSD